MSGRRQTKLSLKDNSSPATSYLLSVLEEKSRGDSTGPFNAGSSTSRVSAAFAALEEISPFCGIYSPILKLVQQELIDAVYSETYTTSATSGSSTTLERIPYFVLLQRLQHDKVSSNDLLLEYKDAHKKNVDKLNLTIQEKENVITELRREINDLQTEHENTVKELIRKDSIIEGMGVQIKSDNNIAEEEVLMLKENVREVERGKIMAQQDSENLRRYKVSYDTLKDTFDLPPDKRPRRGFRRPVISTKKTQLLSSIEAASKLEQQMIEVQTKSLEEYDQYLEEVKSQMSHRLFSDNEFDQNFFTEELQLESLGDEMGSRLKNFQRLISGTVVELELVRQHRDALQSQLSQLEQAENLVAGDAGSNAGTLPPSSMAGGPGSSRMMTHEEAEKKTSLESQFSIESGLEEDTTPLVDPTSDPFNPQERLLSKYSAMIYTSTNSGKTFDEIVSAKFCNSCGEKTAVCPHKVTKKNMVVALPPGCTHIKVARPMVHVTLPSLAQHGMHETESYMHHNGKWYDTIPEVQSWDDPADQYEDISIRRQLAPLWQDAKRRAGIDCSSSVSSVCATRDLTLNRVLSLLEQFYASMLWKDDHSTCEDDACSIREYLYNFMSERYQEDEISPIATYDLITAIVKYSAHEMTVLVLGLSLAGLLDGSMVRYLLIIADLVNVVQWKDVGDFHAFAGALYPSMHEDELEQFVMEYTAFSKNKISKTLIFNYIVHLIAKNKEPRMIDAEAKLSAIKTKEVGNMTSDEFLNAMESISPLANEQLLQRLLRESMLSVALSVLPIKRLASVTGYMSLLQVWQLLKDQIVDKVVDGRLCHREVVSKLEAAPSLVPETGILITITQVELLAGNISRLRRHRNLQSQQSYNEDYYWQSRPNTLDSI